MSGELTPAFTDGIAKVYLGDALGVLRDLPDASVHCCVTSPPYWGLRDYGLGAEGIGLEPTPEEWLARLVEVFREVRRVLRPDGTLWLNVGDTYSAGKAKHPDASGGADLGWSNEQSRRTAKPKDLLMLPARLALALQADGWYLRSDIIYAKPNPMPESVRDRPTSAHEHVFLLSRSPRYFYDAEAIVEAGTTTRPEQLAFGERPDVGFPGRVNDRRRAKPPAGWDLSVGQGGHTASGRFKHDARGERHEGVDDCWQPIEERIIRNARNVWTIATQGYPEAHFATMPEGLARRCISAGTSEYGCCSECGAQWQRVVDRQYVNPGNRSTNGPRSVDRAHLEHGSAGYKARLELRTSTSGWAPSCRHQKALTRPSIVLDPFAGSGTTLAVAKALNRDSIGIELQPDYLPLIVRRLEGKSAQVVLPLEATA